MLAQIAFYPLGRADATLSRVCADLIGRAAITGACALSAGVLPIIVMASNDYHSRHCSF